MALKPHCGQQSEGEKAVGATDMVIVVAMVGTMRWRGWFGSWSGYYGKMGDGRRLLSVVGSNVPSGSMVVVREEEREGFNLQL